MYLQLVIILLKEAFYHAVDTQGNDAYRLPTAIQKSLFDLPETMRSTDHRRLNGQTYYEYVVHAEWMLFYFAVTTGHEEKVTVRELGHMISKGVSKPPQVKIFALAK